MSAAPGPLRPVGAPPPWLIFAITVTGILANALPNAPLPDILEHFDQPAGRAGLFVAAGTLPGILLAPVVGLLADRFGRRAVLVPCLVAFGLFGAAGALAPSFGVLLLLRLGQGAGSAGLINLAVVLVGDHWSGADRARLLGYNAAALTVSIAVLPATGGILAELGGWRLSFVPYLLALGTAAVAYRTLAASPAAVPVSARVQVRAALSAARDRRVAAAIAFGFVLFILIFGLFLTVMPVLLDEDFGLSAGQRGFVLAAPAAGATLAALSLGRLQRFGRARVLLAANALFVVGFVSIGAADLLPVLLLGAACYGLGEGMAIPTVQDLVSGSAPPESRAAVVALFVGAARAGQTVGPLLAGVGLDRLGPSTTFVAGGALAAALLVGQVLLGRRLVAAPAARAAGGA